MLKVCPKIIKKRPFPNGFWTAFTKTNFCLPCAKGGGSAVSRAGGIVFHRRDEKTILQSNLTVCQLLLLGEAFGGKIFCTRFLFSAPFYFLRLPSQSLRDSSPKGRAKLVLCKNLHGSYFEKTIPQSAALTAPFTQRSHHKIYKNRGRVPRFLYFEREKVSYWELSDVCVPQRRNTLSKNYNFSTALRKGGRVPTFLTLSR
jgi:hypothetical protein